MPTARLRRPRLPPRLAAATALAFGAAAAGAVARAGQVEAGGALALSVDEQPRNALAVVSPEVGLRYRPRPFLSLALDWGAASVGSSGALYTEDVTFQAGNPWLSASYVHFRGASAFDAGLGVTLPLAHVAIGGNGRRERMTYAHAMGIRGLWNAWSWTPDRFAVPLVGRAVHMLRPGVSLAGEAALAPLFGSDGSDGNDGSDGRTWLAQAAAEACVSNGFGPRLCARTQVVLLPDSGFDKAQLALGARVTFFPQSWRLFGALLVNLDEPLGFARGTRQWGLFLGKEIAP